MRRLPIATFPVAPSRARLANRVAGAGARALLAMAWLYASVLVGAPTAALARAPNANNVEVDVAKLPTEARVVLVRVRAGGPFPFERDGVVFGNRERLLPVHKRGYYHEYTVETPGAHNRAARRIVCGGPKQAPAVCYYTDDHYASFRRIRE
jgi:ribonuclease T1